VFGLCQIHAFIDYVHSRLTKEQFNILFRGLVLLAAVAGLSAFGVATALGSILYLPQLLVPVPREIRSYCGIPVVSVTVNYANFGTLMNFSDF